MPRPTAAPAEDLPLDGLAAEPPLARARADALSRLRSGIVAARESAAAVRVLLLDPYSPAAAIRAAEIGESPAWLRELPAVDVLRRVLVQNYTRTVGGTARPGDLRDARLVAFPVDGPGSHDRADDCHRDHAAGGR
jgi:hypothetical protein